MRVLLPVIAALASACVTQARLIGDSDPEPVDTDDDAVSFEVSATWLATALDRVAIRGTSEAGCVLVVLVQPAYADVPGAQVSLPEDWGVEHAGGAEADCEPWAPWAFEATAVYGVVDWEPAWPTALAETVDVDLIVEFEVPELPPRVRLWRDDVPLD